MASTTKFVDIVVHSVDGMNERVYLQYDFTQLGIDYYPDKLKITPSEESRAQISAYLDNVFDVVALMNDSSETRSAAIESVSDLEEEISQIKEMYQKLEMDSLSRLFDMEQRIKEICDERDNLIFKQKEITEEVTTLRRTVTQKEEESRNVMEKFPGENLTTEPGSTSKSPNPSPNIPPPTAFAPPPPPPPMMGGVSIKRSLQPKCQLPTLNWTVLKHREVKGTVFNESDDSKYYSVIDFDKFERLFKIGPAEHRNSDDGDGNSQNSSKRLKKPEADSMLEYTRRRNIAISRKKLDLPIETVVKAINALDLTVLNVDLVEILQRIVPNEQESKLYKDFRRDPNTLTEEDKFLLQLSFVERITTKLAVMEYIANYSEIVNVLQPRIHSIMMASRSVRSSEKFHRVLEIILAFGNYMNGAKRGPASGFKIQSLECLTDTKSVDKKQCLMHYIADTIATHFPNLVGFFNDLQFVDKASQVSLDNVLSDLHDLDEGMELTKKESEFLNENNETNAVMRDFLTASGDRLNQIKGECSAAVKDFGDCVEFYGEDRQQNDSNGFFSTILKFTRAYKVSEAENEQKKRLTLKNQSPSPREPNAKLPKLVGMKQQKARINELKTRQGLGCPENKKEVYHGTLEDILSDLENQPYRRTDGPRRSQRRKIDQ